MNIKSALITGITGQDGSYLTDLLLEKKYVVHGIVRRSSSLGRHRLDQEPIDKAIRDGRLFLHYADLTDVTSIRRIVAKVKPDEFYHLAGQSHVGLSFDIPESTCELTAMGTLRIMEILRDQPSPPKFVHASSREIFGSPSIIPQDESTPMCPNSPYGCAKAFATQMVKIYRESHGLFFCNAICYNHESPRRSVDFVTRKISLAAARIKLGLQDELLMGNLDAERDWGYAKEFVEAMWLMAQQPEPDDYVLATGRTSSVKEFLKLSFEHVGLDWEKYYRQDPRFSRPAEPLRLRGDASKAKQVLGWLPTVGMEQLAKIMVDADLERLKGSING